MYSFNKTHGVDVTGGEFEPWMTRDSIKILNSLIKENFIGLEWGSGSSTIWFCERMKFLYTIEHNNEWASFVKKYIEKNKPEFLKKWKFSYIKEDDIPSKDNIFFDCDGISREKYSLADGVPGNLDFICIDGRSRRACIKTALSKLKKSGGILVLDNSDRKEYFPNDIPEEWLCIDTTNGIWKTTIWVSI